MTSYRKILPYGVAIGSTAIAILLTLWLQPLLDKTLGAFFYIAIILSVWYGGFKPGIVAVILSTIAINYFFIPPIYQLHVALNTDLLRLSIFFFVAFTINFLWSNLQESKRKIERLIQKIAKENAEQLRMALAAAQMGMWEWNIVTGIAQCSPEYEELFGLIPGTYDSNYKTLVNRLHPEDRERVIQGIQGCLETHQPYEEEFRVVWNDRTIHWLEVRGKAFYDETGKPLGMTGTAMNIDPRKETENSLRQEGEKQRILMDISHRIRASLNLPDILQTTVDEVRQFLKCDRVTILQFSPSWGGTTVVESVGDGWLKILPLQIYDPCIGEEYVEPFKKGLVTAKSDIYNAGITDCHVEFLASLQVRANLVVPILQHDNLWGLLAAHNCAGPRHWEDSEITLLQQLADQVGIAIHQGALFAEIQTELAQRKQYELTLIRNKSRLKLAQISSNSGIWDWDVINNTLFWSEEYYQLYQIDPTIEPSYEHWLNSIHPEDREKTDMQTRKALETSSELRIEFRVILPSGVRWFAGIGQIFRNEKNEPERMIGMSIDINQKKEIEIALVQLNNELEERITQRTAELTIANERLLATVREKEQAEIVLQQYIAEIEDLYNNAPCGYHSLNPEGAIIRINDTELNWLGYTREELLNKKFTDLVTAKCKQIFRDNFTKFKQDGFVNNLEFEMTQKDGTTRWLNLNATAIKDEAGNFIVSRSSLFDITDKKIIEEALQESEEKFRQLAENIQDVFWLLDVESQKIIYISPTYKTIWQRNCQTVYENPLAWLEAIHPDDLERVKSAYLNMVKTAEYDEKYRIIQPDGSHRWIRDRAFPIKNEFGEIIRIAGIAEDITDTQKVEQMKSEFIGIVSHELRTPLTAIKMSLGLLKSGIYNKKPEKFQRMLDIALIDTNRLVNLVNDILDLERLDSGRAVLDKNSCQAIDLMTRAVEGIQPIATAQQMTLIINPSEAQVSAAADAIIQTITNLLSNAIKFSPPNSTITLSAQLQSNLVLFQVCDRGRGIPSDKLEAIFGRFHQVDASDARDKGGTGLGLAICRSIIEQHGGKIWVESTFGEGSTFCFTLPLAVKETIQ